ncbi:MAG: 2-C-methyl-D-erythritol 4-phosphate cytidylyltransferase, partial [Bacteroidota bacterium]|nr:2-C-methyl-D-erythritol 4-phosphate cytidylyltransferase [Bacteroidota bacterium]
LVLPAAFCENQELIESICGEVPPVGITVVEGGDSRFQSVKNGLAHCDKPSVVFVHDGVRCLVSPALIRRCYEQAISLGSAIPAVAATDSVRIAQGDKHTSVDRSEVRLVQTPQTFLTEILLDAFQQPQQDAFTDEATVVEAFGGKIHLIDGEYSNIKITRPVDLIIAEQILLERESR